MHFSSGGHHQTLQRPVVDDRAGPTNNIPKRRVDRALDQIDQIRPPIWRRWGTTQR
jgi:hypothetical protein